MFRKRISDRLTTCQGCHEMIQPKQTIYVYSGEPTPEIAKGNYCCECFAKITQKKESVLSCPTNKTALRTFGMRRVR
jgi:hypothetical protein